MPACSDWQSSDSGTPGPWRKALKATHRPAVVPKLQMERPIEQQ